MKEECGVLGKKQEYSYTEADKQQFRNMAYDLIDEGKNRTEVLQTSNNMFGMIPTQERNKLYEQMIRLWKSDNELDNKKRMDKLMNTPFLEWDKDDIVFFQIENKSILKTFLPPNTSYRNNRGRKRIKTSQEFQDYVDWQFKDADEETKNRWLPDWNREIAIWKKYEEMGYTIN